MNLTVFLARGDAEPTTDSDYYGGAYVPGLEEIETIRLAADDEFDDDDFDDELDGEDEDDEFDDDDFDEEGDDEFDDDEDEEDDFDEEDDEEFEDEEDAA